MSILEILDEVSHGAFIRPDNEDYNFFGDEQRLLSIAARASLLQSVAYFETDENMLTLVRDYGSFSYGEHSRVHSRIALPDGVEFEIFDPISHQAFGGRNEVKDFFVLIEHCIYTVVKWKCFPSEEYPEGASWETHGDRLTRLRKAKLITRADEKCFRILGDARNKYFHTLLFPSNISVFDIPLDEFSNYDFRDVFKANISPSLEKIWKLYAEIQHMQVDWRVFNLIVSLAK